mgnify:CR=1 FL=1
MKIKVKLKHKGDFINAQREKSQQHIWERKEKTNYKTNVWEFYEGIFEKTN